VHTSSADLFWSMIFVARSAIHFPLFRLRRGGELFEFHLPFALSIYLQPCISLSGSKEGEGSRNRLSFLPPASLLQSTSYDRNKSPIGAVISTPTLSKFSEIHLSPALYLAFPLCIDQKREVGEEKGIFPTRLLLRLLITLAIKKGIKKV
jgi:hypothetical protein